MIGDLGGEGSPWRGTSTLLAALNSWGLNIALEHQGVNGSQPAGCELLSWEGVWLLCRHFVFILSLSGASLWCSQCLV